MAGKRRSGLLSVILAALILAAPIRSQETQPPPEPAAPGQDRPRESQLTEHVEVRLVQIPVLAQDRQGRPVSDLTAEEIVVKDRGRRMKIAFLDPYASESSRPGPEGQVRLYVGAPGGWEGVVDSAAGEPRYMLIFIDVENDDKLRRSDAAEQARRFVREQLDPAYRTAVMSYNGEIHLEVTFTQDREAVATAILRGYGRAPRPQLDLQARMRGLIQKLEECEVGAAGAFQRTADEACVRSIALEYADEVRPEKRDYLQALEGLVRFAGGLKGHKTILALSHGTAVDPTSEVIEAMRAYYGNTEQIAALQLQIQGEGTRLEMDRLLDFAVEQRVTLHFVDRNTPPSGDFGARLGQAYQPGARPMTAAFVAAQMDMEEMAAHTGGVFVRSTDVFRGMKQAVDLERGAYLLGYYVEEDLSPRQLAKVSVDTSRRGVEIVHRRGYYARPAIADALAGSIKLGEPVALAEEGRPGQFVPFRIVADPRGLGYQVAGSEAVADLTLHFRVETEDGRALADSYHFINHAYPRELWEKGDVEPIILRGWVELPPWDYRLVAVLRNARTGVGGELACTLSVPGGAGTPQPAPHFE